MTSSSLGSCGAAAADSAAAADGAAAAGSAAAAGGGVAAPSSVAETGALAAAGSARDGVAAACSAAACSGSTAWGLPSSSCRPQIECMNENRHPVPLSTATARLGGGKEGMLSRPARGQASGSTHAQVHARCMRGADMLAVHTSDRSASRWLAIALAEGSGIQEAAAAGPSRRPASSCCASLHDVQRSLFRHGHKRTLHISRQPHPWPLALSEALKMHQPGLPHANQLPPGTLNTQIGLFFISPMPHAEKTQDSGACLFEEECR